MVTAIIFCLITSLAVPFAGFFASGWKRAYKIKDFAESLPGHGGFIDRFDCMLYMGCIALCVLSSSFLLKDSNDVQKAMTIIHKMDGGQ